MTLLARTKVPFFSKQTVGFIPILAHGPDLYPAGPFTISEPENPEIGEFYIFQERRAVDLVTPKL